MIDLFWVGFILFGIGAIGISITEPNLIEINQLGERIWPKVSAGEQISAWFAMAGIIIIIGRVVYWLANV
ncbi:hypothetical protein [Ralstonia phage RSP15]|uniref:hypothetical protein n=1 Tax=Ralstonia phage RSP15 TaxID=1785960 RepID=UPI00074D3EB7|nr:hypothetical protein BH754_gp026 [Ralstonia phage RSP15]BAU39984.1 hypothetical protein [Ralstonia phage RSP15]